MTSANNRFLLPDGNVQVCFSGGRTSAYLLWKILDANDGLPDRARVVFTNTGREMPQTLNFVAECASRWGIHIDWVEYRAEAPFFETVSHNSAARQGEPFAAMNAKKLYLPNFHTRFCTTELKVRPAKRFLRSLGWERWTCAIGIRADEPRRLSKTPPKDRWTNWYPLADAGVAKRNVSAFWQAQAFDLALPNIKGRCPLGNCDGCFLKSEANIAALIRDYPERAAWWEEQERVVQVTAKKPTDAQFSRAFSRAGLRDFVQRQSDWIFNDEAYLCQTDGGECVY